MSWSAARWRPAALALGIALLAGSLILQEARRSSEAVYYTQVNVRFLPPSKTPGNVLEGSSDSLIHFAALIERTVNGHDLTPRLASPEAPLYGRGVRDGESITLIDRGGQWQTNFNTPALSVEVVAPSAQRLEARLQDVIGVIEEATGQQQAALDVPDDRRITTALSPPVPVLVEIGGRPSRALVGTAISAILVAILATAVFRASSSRDRSQPRPAVAKEPL